MAVGKIMFKASNKRSVAELKLVLIIKTALLVVIGATYVNKL